MPPLSSFHPDFGVVFMALALAFVIFFIIKG